MWHADKAPFQHELATKMAQLIHSCSSVEISLVYLSVFMETLSREWEGIDRLRTDKFYALLGIMLAEALKLLEQHKWDQGLAGGAGIGPAYAGRRDRQI